MQVTLYKNNSDNNVMNKNITLLNVKDVKLKNLTNIINPVLLLNENVSDDVNYIHIQAWNRYYYVTNKNSVSNDLCELTCRVDVLMSHKNNILNSTGLVIASENLKNDYIASDIYVNDVREKTNIINFSNGFNDNPEFVLITAGATI